MNQHKKAFTLVELIVVVTILAILSTIGFVSYSSYLTGVRDTNRISNMKAISDGLELYRTKYSLPLPEDGVEVKANGAVIAYQGYAGANVLESIEFSNGGKDPKNDIYYSYYLTKDKKYFQLMGFLEEEDNLQTNLFNQTNALDYSILIPTVYGKKLGILTDDTNTPVQEVSSIATAKKIELDTTNSGTVYSMHINDGRTYTFTGRILNHKLYTLSKPGTYGPPKDCPDGFIASWGDSAFSQVGFCVAQYEMSYTEEDSPLNPNSTFDGPDNNTYSFDDDFNDILEVAETGYGKAISSRAGDYTITEITQGQAIDACKSMGKGYHLIMSNEWMSLTRQIEFEKENWSILEVGNGYIYNGVSGNTELGCDSEGGNNDSRTYATKTGPGNNSCDEKRKHKLFNSQEIWDIAGNVAEHVNKNNTLDGSGYNSLEIDLGSGSEWEGWENTDISFIEKSIYGPLIAKNESQGIGAIQHIAGISGNILIRGGAAWNTDNTGLYSMKLDRILTSQNDYVGFRCAYIK